MDTQLMYALLHVFLLLPLLQCAATALRMSDDSSDVLADLEALDSVLSDDNDDSDLEPRQPYLNNLAMQAAKREWQKQAGDSGSAQVQVSSSCRLIDAATTHI
jgi:hypothetical protein